MHKDFEIPVQFDIEYLNLLKKLWYLHNFKVIVLNLEYGMIWYGIWYGIIWYGTIWHGIVWYGMVWYGIIWITIILFLY